jgi:hypothetical protein
MFGAKDVKETQGGGYIKPGIHEVTIDSVTGGYSTTGTPKLTFKLYLKDGDSSKAQDFNIFISEKSEEMAYRKIKHIFTKVSTEENYNTVTGSTIEELAENLETDEENLTNLLDAAVEKYNAFKELAKASTNA